MYRLISFVKGAALGAGLMYYFDPALGNRRRALVRDQLHHLVAKGRRVADARYRDAQNRLYGTYASMRSSLRDDEPTDDVLRDRVRSTIGRHLSHPRAIEVDVHDGVVLLSGPVLAREVDGLLCAVESVRGVAGVKDQLEVHQSAGNVSALQGGQQSA